MPPSRTTSIAIYAAVASCQSAAIEPSALPASPTTTSSSLDALVADMSDAATRWLASLDGDRATRARYALDDAERLDWHFIPRTRHGVSLGELSPSQRALAFGFLAAAVSRRGLVKATSIMALEQTLHDREHGRGDFVRDPSAYYLTIFGTPSETATWGWRLEGHHLSISLTIVDGHRVVIAPAFFGASPAVTDTGTRVLGREEQLGLDLVSSLDDRQRAIAMSAPPSSTETIGGAPDDILTGPGATLTELPGLRGSQMTRQQRDKLAALVDEAAGNLPFVAATSDLDQTVFTWSGARTIDQPHYYRLSGPTFVYELDNTQEHANHVHTVWHVRSSGGGGLGGDFGADLLREHSRAEHASRGQP